MLKGGKMKKILIFFVLWLVFLPLAEATVGVGIKWKTESEIVEEGSTQCITYGLYNPFDEDVMGFLEVTGDLENISKAEEPKLIPAGTDSEHAIPTQICFFIPKVYKEDCLLPGLFCEKKCEEEQVILKGQVVAAYQLKAIGGTGSTTGSSFAVPLSLIVKCEPVKRNLMPLYLLIALVAVLILLIVLRKRIR